MSTLALILGLTGNTFALHMSVPVPMRADAPPPKPLDRTRLPIAEPPIPVITEIDPRKVTPPPRFEVRVPADAPNVVIVLIDDMGFGHSSDSRRKGFVSIDFTRRRSVRRRARRCSQGAITT
jgi:hypothetical protein